MNEEKTGYERTLLHECLIAKYVAWFLWLLLLALGTLAIVYDSRLWVSVGITAFAAWWAAKTEQTAERKLKEWAIAQQGGVSR